MAHIENQVQLLRLLADGHLHSAAALSAALQLPAAALWEIAQSLEQTGMAIESSIAHGYRLPGGLELLDQEQIWRQLQPTAQSRLDELLILDLVDSTNTYLLEKAKTTHRQTACFAEQQTAGKGQRGKRWVAPFASHVCFSLLWHFEKTPNEMMGLSLAIAVAVARALQRYGVTSGLGLKWPNDVYHNGRKLCGILLETAVAPPAVFQVVIGVGVNIHLTAPQAAAIEQAWTGLQTVVAEKVQRNRLAGLLLNELLLALPVFAQHGLTPFLTDWQKWDYLAGKKVSIILPQSTAIGIMQGISPTGELLLLDEKQQLQHFLNGSVRLTA